MLGHRTAVGTLLLLFWTSQRFVVADTLEVGDLLNGSENNPRNNHNGANRAVRPHQVSELATQQQRGDAASG